MLARVLSSFFSGAVVLAMLVACNDHDPHPAALTEPGNTITPGGGGGGGTSTDGGINTTDSGGGDADSGTCSDLALDGSTAAVDQNGVSDDSIAGTGGTLVDGIYDLTAAEKFVGASGQAGPTGVTYKEVIRITGGVKLERVRTVQQGGGIATTSNETYVIQLVSPKITLTESCPQPSVGTQYSYTADVGTLKLTSAAEQFTYRPRP